MTAMRVEGGGPVHRTPTVEVAHLNHTFGEGETRNPVLLDNNLDLYPGEIVIMMGKSGSGKTTLLTLIGALRKVQEGSLRVWGRELRGLRGPELVQVRREIGFIFQAHNLFGSLTALQNIRLALELTGMSETQMRQRGVELLTRLNLGERVDFKPEKLSGGQRQRVAIARALANRPRLILADEPTAALDEESARIVVDLLKELAAEQQSTIIVVTHDNKILDAADRIVNMSYGHIISDAKNVRQLVEICEFLKGSQVFADLSEGDLSEVAGKMVYEVHPPGTVVIRQGAKGDKLYIIRKGLVDVLVAQNGTQQKVASLQQGDLFGEAAIIHDAPRNATVVATSELELYALAAADFRAAMASSPTFDQRIRVLLSRRQ